LRKLLVVLALSLGVFPATADITAPAPWCHAGGPLEASTLPRRVLPHVCDLEGRTIRDGPLRIVVPPPGQMVGSEAMFTDGSTQLFEVRTLADGSVTFRDVGPESVEGHNTHGGGTAGPHQNPCTDDAYTLSEARDTGPHEWFFKASTTPSGLSVGAVAQDLLTGTNAVTSSHNDCELADEVDAHQAYRGNTTRGSGINFEGTCGSEGDGHYTVDFGNLPDNNLARTCWRGLKTAEGWYEITEADVKLRNAATFFTGVTPRGCSGSRFSLQAVITHEVGHVYGIRHVTEDLHPELTMSERTPACSVDPVTLGLGDIMALRALY